VLETKALVLDGKPALTGCYVMELVEPVFPDKLEEEGNEGRKLRWLSGKEAIAEATHPETKDWLTKARQLLDRPGASPLAPQ